MIGLLREPKALTKSTTKNCSEACTQNKKESLNTVICSITPNVQYSNAKIVESASYIPDSTFNDLYTSVLCIPKL